MLSPDIILAAVLNGLMNGAIYALIALGLTLVYGVLHIINFAHGATLTAAMFVVFIAFTVFGIDPFVMIPAMALGFFGLGYALQRFVVGPAAQGSDNNVLLITLGLSIMIENGLLAVFHSDTRSIDVPYGFSSFDLGFTFLSVPKVAGFGVSLAVALVLWVILIRTDTGKAIRAVARERMGAELAGIDVEHIFAVTFGLGAATVAIAACLLMPTFYVSPRIGNAFVLVAFTIVVLGGMGSIPGAVTGALIVGVIESVSGLFLDESLGQLGIFILFILVLLLRPTGLFGART